MAFETWLGEDGKTHYTIRCVARSRANRLLRVRKQAKGSFDETNPEAVRKKLNWIEVGLATDARRELAELEDAGVTWGDLVRKWELGLNEELRDPERIRLKKPVKISTAKTYIQAVNDFTGHWFKRPATDINPADVEDVFNRMAALGYSNCRMYNAKVAISRCFRWGIVRRMIPQMTTPPTEGFGISRKDSKRPEILNVLQVTFLLDEAFRENHPWRHVWKAAYHSGGRSGELYQLKRKHIDLTERMLHLEEKWNFGTKKVEGLKDGEWRHVPINEDLHELFLELGAQTMHPEDHVLPRINAWRNGEGADVLRKYCDKIGVPSICLHTLRACWATQLLKNSVDQATVMSMGGWADPDTMHRYIRLAGIDVKGGTDSLSSKKRERPARVFKLVRAEAVEGGVREKIPLPLTSAKPATGDDENQSENNALRRKLEAREALLEKLLSSDPKIAEAAALEYAEARRKQL
ncbi:site-specific integrase [Bdellovibrionota bacterium FG-2]